MATGEDAADDVLLYFMLMPDGRQRLCPYVLALTGHRMDGLQEIPSFPSSTTTLSFATPQFPSHHLTLEQKSKRRQAWNPASSKSLRVGRSPPKLQAITKETDLYLSLILWK